MSEKQHVVIIGAGFAGLQVPRGLGAGGVRATLLDRQNYHLFQPLLYQVATAALSAADIAEPVRRMLRRFPSVEVLLGVVTGIDVAARRVALADGKSYDRNRRASSRDLTWRASDTRPTITGRG
jgi:NADH dehydrogenase